MIVCICNNVSDRKIRQAVDSGMSTMTEIRDLLDVGTSCGKCYACAKAVLHESLEDAKAKAHPVFFQQGALAA